MTIGSRICNAERAAAVFTLAMHARISTTPGPSTFQSNYKANSSPVPTYDVLAPDSHGFTSSSALGAKGARRRVGSGEDLDDPWGDGNEPMATSSASASSNGRTGLRSRSRSHSTHANGQTHPLQVNGNDGGADTRPGLRRMLSSKDGKGGVWGFSDGWVEDDEEGPKEDRPNGASREMLVHKIQPRDSLAGVALRYGVSIADVRKVNKLWASDSIHLRSVLYIPLNANLKLGYSPNLIDLRTPNQERDAQLSPSDQTSTSADDTTSNSSVAPAEDKPTIQHVPVSELSFFPPPTISPKKPGARARTVPRSVSSPFGSSQLLFTPGLSSASLNVSPFFSNQQLSSSPSRGPGPISSLFSALPLPEAVQRLSLDSIAGGALTPRATSSASDLSEQLVELNTMSTRSTLGGAKPKRTIRTQPTHGPVMTVPRRSVEGGDQGTNRGFAAVVDEDW